MADEPSDPKIVDRLGKLPPFKDAEGKLKDAPVDAPVEEVPPVEEVQPEVAPETPPAPEITPEAAKVEVTEEEALKNSKQPERTAAYIEKLKEQNKELKKNILDSLIPQNPQPQVPQEPRYPEPPTTNVVPKDYPGVSHGQIKETFQGLVDDNGYVDTGLLISTLKELQEKNRIANEEVQRTRQESQNTNRRLDDFERNGIMREVHSIYPTLNPENENFDEKLWKFVRNEVVDQWMNGKPTDVMAAAAEGMATLHGEDMKKAEKQKLEQAEKAKRDINALSASSASQRESNPDQDALIKATQMGKKGALAERLKRAGL